MCEGVVGGVQGVFCVRNGSGQAEKWTSVSPCSWDKRAGRWKAICKGRTIGGCHATEVAAAQTYNIEAERLGLPLNVIPPAGDAASAAPAASASPAAPAAPVASAALAFPSPAAPAREYAGVVYKRAASTSRASLRTKAMRLDTAVGATCAVSAVGSAAGSRAAAAAAAQGAALKARMMVSMATAEVAGLHTKGAHVSTALAVAQLAVHAAEQAAAEAERTAALLTRHEPQRNMYGYVTIRR